MTASSYQLSGLQGSPEKSCVWLSPTLAQTSCATLIEINSEESLPTLVCNTVVCEDRAEAVARTKTFESDLTHVEPDGDSGQRGRPELGRTKTFESDWTHATPDRSGAPSRGAEAPERTQTFESDWTHSRRDGNSCAAERAEPAVRTQTFESDLTHSRLGGNSCAAEGLEPLGRTRTFESDWTHARPDASGPQDIAEMPGRTKTFESDRSQGGPAGATLEEGQSRAEVCTPPTIPAFADAAAKGKEPPGRTRTFESDWTHALPDGGNVRDVAEMPCRTKTFESDRSQGGPAAATTQQEGRSRAEVCTPPTIPAFADAAAPRSPNPMDAANPQDPPALEPDVQPTLSLPPIEARTATFCPDAAAGPLEPPGVGGPPAADRVLRESPTMKYDGDEEAWRQWRVRLPGGRSGASASGDDGHRAGEAAAAHAPTLVLEDAPESSAPSAQSRGVGEAVGLGEAGAGGSQHREPALCTDQAYMPTLVLAEEHANPAAPSDMEVDVATAYMPTLVLVEERVEHADGGTPRDVEPHGAVVPPRPASPALSARTSDASKETLIMGGSPARASGPSRSAELAISNDVGVAGALRGPEDLAAESRAGVAPMAGDAPTAGDAPMVGDAPAELAVEASQPLTADAKDGRVPMQQLPAPLQPQLDSSMPPAELAGEMVEAQNDSLHGQPAPAQSRPLPPVSAQSRPLPDSSMPPVESASATAALPSAVATASRAAVVDAPPDALGGAQNGGTSRRKRLLGKRPRDVQTGAPQARPVVPTEAPLARCPERTLTSEIRRTIGHSLSPPEQGCLVRVHGDGWGGGHGDFTGTVTEADEFTFTVVRHATRGATWEETHVLREHCTVLPAEAPSEKRRRT